MTTAATPAIGCIETGNDIQGGNLLVECAFFFAGTLHFRDLDSRRRQLLQRLALLITLGSAKYPGIAPMP